MSKQCNTDRSLISSEHLFTPHWNILQMCSDTAGDLQRTCTDAQAEVGFLSCEVQWNLGNSNANFSKLTDFSKTTDGPEFFHYNLLQKYHRFFEFQFFEKINFSNRFVGPKQRNSY